MTKANNAKATEATVTEAQVTEVPVNEESTIEAHVEEVATVYLATDTLNHNGKRYNTGDVVEELTNEQAKRLLAANVLVVGVPEHGVVLI